MTTSTKEIDFSGEDETGGTTAAATATAPPEAPEADPTPQTDTPDCPTHTHLHPDGTSHPGILCSGGCPR